MNLIPLDKVWSLSLDKKMRLREKNFTKNSESDLLIYFLILVSSTTRKGKADEGWLRKALPDPHDRCQNISAKAKQGEMILELDNNWSK